MNKYGIDIFELDDPDNETPLVTRLHDVADRLGQTQTGHFLLHEAQNSGLCIILRSDINELIQYRPKELVLPDQPVIEINPVLTRRAIVEKTGNASAEKIDEIFDDFLHSYLVHELRHGAQHEKFGPILLQGRIPQTYLAHNQCAEADAYAWQNLGEMELQNSGLRPGIRDNMAIISSRRQRMYENAMEGDERSLSEQEILERTAAQYFYEQDVYFNGYMENSVGNAERYYRTCGDENNQEISLPVIVDGIFAGRDGKPYIRAETVQILIDDAYAHLPAGLAARMHGLEAISKMKAKPDRHHT